MNDRSKISKAAAEGRGDEASLFDLLFVFAKNKRLIFGLPVVVAVLTLGISLLLPVTYRASTTIMPPQQAQGGAAALLAQLGGAMGAVASATGIKNPSDLYIGMLKSRSISDKLVARFDLLKVYDVTSLEKARKELELNTSINSSKEGFITVSVEDNDKSRVAAIANAYIEELSTLNRTLAITEASRRRLFFEQQLEQAKNNLAAAESALKKGIDVSGVVSVDAESRAVVETVARLRAQVSAKEIQLNAMRQFVTANHQDFKRVEQELFSLRGELDRLENGSAGASGAGDKAPGGLENIKTLRQVKYNQMLYELLAKQYEAARLDEARDASVIQTLDAAISPEKQYSPKPVRLTAIAFVIGFFLAQSPVRCVSKTFPKNGAQCRRSCDSRTSSFNCALCRRLCPSERSSYCGS
jgi:tyrosine-protein kinase Etk/Wzc